ncbi:saccharopine dehydrogenase NADP-binding domain-containing protein [bacterium]|nr:saccharopine dehydrogenase NADP-binding domain-containing protein [bacterium]
MKIIVLGGGLIGQVIAKNLLKDFEVTVADLNPKTLEKLKTFRIDGILADLSDAEKIKEIIKPFDLVVGAVPGFMGYKMLKSVLEAGKNIVDISFFPEDCFTLDELAKSKNVTAIVDCGVAPGCSNLICGHVETLFDKTDEFVCYVGGLPQVRVLPYEYKAVFSPIDVIEEYTRPAKLVENGKIVVKEALSEPELVDFEGVGTLEAFNTDGLRTLLKTVKIPSMREKTLRYATHIEKMRLLRETGFFWKEKIEIGGVKISPLEVTSKLLFDLWKLKENEEDFTVMKVIVEGEKDGKKVTYTYDLLDKFDRQNKITSMARTTGYTCTSAVRLLANGDFTQKGICPPEFIGKNGKCFQKMMDYLKTENIVFELKIS